MFISLITKFFNRKKFEAFKNNGRGCKAAFLQKSQFLKIVVDFFKRLAQ
jgi:hypothetical protein